MMQTRSLLDGVAMPFGLAATGSGRLAIVIDIHAERWRRGCKRYDWAAIEVTVGAMEPDGRAQVLDSAAKDLEVR